MPTKRTAAKAATTDSTVTVQVIPPHAVYHDGEQRGGTLTGVDRDTANHWTKHGWATITTEQAEATTQ